ncbi:MAG TPA: hypothetical protein DGH68_00375 [Bacteroidetes bacterium]|jgi:CheY-like chemotaxis protein|nr:hypothetical protein [Bacteroidota bacterium]
MKIMVVDNDPVYLGLLAEILQLHGYDVTAVHDGEEALSKLKEVPVDFILSDISMPKMNGMSLHRYIRQDPKLKHLPFAWNSGYRELRDAAKVEDPSIDLKFEKAMPIPNLLFFLSHFASGGRRRSKGHESAAC